MVDEGCCAMSDGIHKTWQDRVLNALRIQRTIERPPQSLQDFREIFWRRTRNRHAARKGAVKVGVRADISRHDVLTLRVEALFVWIFFHQRLAYARILDAVTFDKDC